MGETMNLGQLRWRCRRGMRELDRAFVYVLNEVYPQRDAEFQAVFARFTEEQDPDILAMLSGRMEVPAPYQELVEIMRNCGAFASNAN